MELRVARFRASEFEREDVSHPCPADVQLGDHDSGINPQILPRVSRIHVFGVRAHKEQETLSSQFYSKGLHATHNVGILSLSAVDAWTQGPIYVGTPHMPSVLLNVAVRETLKKGGAV